MKLRNYIGYEYRKMAKRKSFWVALLLTPVLLVFLASGTVMGKIYVENELAGTHMDEIAIRKEEAKELNGTVLTEEYFREIRERKYERPAEGYTASNYLEYEEKNAEQSMINEVIYALAQGQDTGSVYSAWKEGMTARWEEKGLNAEEISWLQEQAESTGTPWTYAYNEGYGVFAGYMPISILCMAVLLTICLSPMFAEEYSLGTDVLLLTSRNGRREVAAAKLIAGLSFSAVSSALFYGLFLAGQILIYGAGDVSAAVQTLSVFSNVPYDLNVGQAALLLLTAGVLSSMVTGAVVMACSAAMRSSFGPAVLGLIFAFLPLFAAMMPEESGNRLLASAVNAVPGVYGTVRSLFSCCLLSVGNLHFTAYQYLAVLYLIALALLAIFAAKQYLGRQPA